MLFQSLRRLHPAADKSGHAAQAGRQVEVSIGGRKVVSFAGNDWLGLGKHPEVIAAGCRAFLQHGPGPADMALVHDLEDRAAEFFGKEAAVFPGSGCPANDLFLKMAGRDAVVFLDECAPPRLRASALVAGLTVHTFCPCDPGDLQARISSLLPPGGVPVVMTEGILPATGILPPLQDYMRVLAACATAVLIVDDRLGPGALGPMGRGSLEELGLDDRTNRLRGEGGVKVFSSSGLPLADGLGEGIACGSRGFAEQVREMHAEEETHSQPAALVAAAAQALQIAASEFHPARAVLLTNSARLRHGMSQLGLELPGVPAPFFGLQIGTPANMERIRRELLAAGMFVPVVRIPGTGKVLRFAVTSGHTHAMVDALLRALCLIL